MKKYRTSNKKVKTRNASTRVTVSQVLDGDFRDERPTSVVMNKL
jgi:hypothetical protein